MYNFLGNDIVYLILISGYQRCRTHYFWLWCRIWRQTVSSKICILQTTLLFICVSMSDDVISFPCVTLNDSVITD